MRIALVAAALASFIVFMWMETTLGRSPLRGWIFFVGYVVLAWLLDRGGASKSFGGLLKYAGLDRLNAADLLRSLLCWGGGIAWVYGAALVTNDNEVGAVITFGPLSLSIVAGSVFAVRSFGIFGKPNKNDPKA